MSIKDLLAAQRPTLSYELFPPRSDRAEATLEATMEVLAGTHPDFISITYGASGTTRSTSRGVVQKLAERHTIPPLAHLTCVDQSRAELTQVIEAYLAEGVRDFLALRGDPPKGQADWRPHPDGLLYASELVALLREVAAAHGTDISIGVTAFPAQHAIEQWRQQGLDVLRHKQEAGADFAITQVFYEVPHYSALVADAAAQGIHLPIVPEVMPLISATRAHRAAELTGVATPEDLVGQLEAAGEDADAALAAGVAHAAGLSRDLLDAGAPGIHIITFNKHQAATALVGELGLGRS